MIDKLTGSDLTRTMLERDHIKKIWCAVDDESDHQAISYLTGNDFTAYIVKFHNGYFYCDGGMRWLYAVPIKIRAITHKEAFFLPEDSFGHLKATYRKLTHERLVQVKKTSNQSH